MLSDEEAAYMEGYKAGYHNAAMVDIPNWLTDIGQEGAAIALVTKLKAVEPKVELRRPVSPTTQDAVEQLEKIL